MNSSKPRMILSPCGISILINSCHQQDRSLVITRANDKVTDIPPEELDKLTSIINQVKSDAISYSPIEAGEKSSELNAIVKYYNKGEISIGKSDYHAILHTDTWLGEQSAIIIQDWLKKHGIPNVELLKMNDLNTSDQKEFHWALTDLIKELHSRLERAQESYYVIFNLTGGFKIISGFLQTLAMFYADEVIYIFETNKELLHLPRLPAKLDFEIQEEQIEVFRRLSCEARVSTEAVKIIKEMLWVSSDGEASISAWGTIIWENQKRTVYEKKLHSSPSDRIVFGNNFEKSLKQYKDESHLANRITNETIDDLMRYLEKGISLNSSKMKILKGNPVPGSTHEIYASSDNGAPRIYFHYDEQNRAILDKLDKHLK